jgi:hypothetical protein
MMRVVFGLALALLVPASAWAQRLPFAVSERPAIGVTFGGASTGATYNTGASPEVGFVFDTPIVFGYRLRADVTRVAWPFDASDYGGGRRFIDTVTLKTVSVSVLRVRHLDARTTAFGGIGYGSYHYGQARFPPDRPWRDGAHAIAGLELLEPGQHLAFDGEVCIDAVQGSGEPPVYGSALYKLRAAIGMKVRF